MWLKHSGRSANEEERKWRDRRAKNCNQTRRTLPSQLRTEGFESRRAVVHHRTCSSTPSKMYKWNAMHRRAQATSAAGSQATSCQHKPLALQRGTIQQARPLSHQLWKRQNAALTCIKLSRARPECSPLRHPYQAIAVRHPRPPWLGASRQREGSGRDHPQWRRRRLLDHYCPRSRQQGLWGEVRRLWPPRSCLPLVQSLARTPRGPTP